MAFGIFPQDLIKESLKRLTARYPRDAHTDGHSTLAWSKIGCAAELSACIATGDNEEAWRHPALYLRKDAPGPLTAEDVLDALTLSANATRERLQAERQLIEMARRRQISWPQIAKALGFRDVREVQRHHRRLVDLLGGDKLSAVGGRA